MRQVLRFDYEKVNGARVDSVHGVDPRIWSDGAFSCDLLVIRAGNHDIVVSVNIDTDEIVVELDDGNLKFEHSFYDVGFRDQLVDLNPILNFTGKRLGWSWEVANYLGYADGFLLAFKNKIGDALKPAIALIGEGSSITFLTISSLCPDQEAIQSVFGADP